MGGAFPGCFLQFNFNIPKLTRMIPYDVIKRTVVITGTSHQQWKEKSQ